MAKITQTFVLHCMYYSLNYIIFAETYDGPENVVAFINGTATLGCRSAGNLDEVRWVFTEVGSGKEVHYNQKLPTSKAARWSVNRTGRHSRLIITGIEPRDAGLFVCIAEAEQYEALLVILGNLSLKLFSKAEWINEHAVGRLEHYFSTKSQWNSYCWHILYHAIPSRFSDAN